MSFHDQQSELSTINRESHIHSIAIDPWTSQIIRIAQDIEQHSDGLFNCGIGHRLVAAGLLPRNIDFSNHGFGGIEDLCFIDENRVRSALPLCLDLGGIDVFPGINIRCLENLCFPVIGHLHNAKQPAQFRNLFVGCLLYRFINSRHVSSKAVRRLSITRTR